MTDCLRAIIDPGIFRVLFIDGYVCDFVTEDFGRTRMAIDVRTHGAIVGTTTIKPVVHQGFVYTDADDFLDSAEEVESDADSDAPVLPL